MYVVGGQLFFVSVEQFLAGFDFRESVDQIEIDLSRAHVWDASAVAAVDRVVLKLRSQGANVHISGLNGASTDLLRRLATHDQPGAVTASGH